MGIVWKPSNTPVPPRRDQAVKLNTGEPCSTCGEQKSTGLVNLVKGLAYGAAEESVKAARLEHCAQCTRVDGTGERLYRLIEGAPYCGVPRFDKIWRDERRDGCGCSLEFKAGRAEAACPWGDWQGESRHVEGHIALNFRLEAWGIGDVCMASCVLAGVKAADPARGVGFEVREHLIPWAKLFSTADKLRPYGTDRGQRVISIDKDFELGRTPASPAAEGAANWHELWAARFGARPLHPQVEIPAEARAWAQQSIAAIRKPLAILAPFAAYANRTWPMRRWIELEDFLIAAGAGVIVLDAPGDGARTNGFKSMRYWGQAAAQVAAQVEASDLVIANESGLGHVAGMLGKPALVLCGPTDGRQTHGFYGCVEPVFGALPCSGCHWRPENGYERGCDFLCESLHSIPAAHVAARAVALMRMK